MKKKLILFIDSGDTLVDEGTQVWDPAGTELVLETGLIEGAAGALKTLHKEGFLIALVADGRELSFQNVYTRQYGLRHCFDAWIVSETVGICKPAPEMFRSAMDALHLKDGDKPNIVMVGNNLARDVRGANLFGIASVWIDWSPRYSREPADAWEIPDYTIHSPAELPALLERLETMLERGEKLKASR